MNEQPMVNSLEQLARQTMPLNLSLFRHLGNAQDAMLLTMLLAYYRHYQLQPFTLSNSEIQRTLHFRASQIRVSKKRLLSSGLLKRTRAGMPALFYYELDVELLLQVPLNQP